MRELALSNMHKNFFWALALCLALVGCGGGDIKPQVTAIKVAALQYGRTATIYLGGADLRTSMQVDTGGACTSPTFSSASTPETAVLNCKVAQVGDFVLSIKSAQGDAVYSTTLTVLKPQVLLSTGSDSITLELDPASAPVTVNNFLGYVNSGYYTKTLFHRVIAGFVIQAGGYTAGLVKKAGQGAPIVLETQKDGPSNLRGTVAMARTSDPNSATSEFFVNLVDNKFLDFQSAASPGYAVFGKVTQGLNVVDAIAAQSTGSLNGFGDVPLTDITITLALQIQ